MIHAPTRLQDVAIERLSLRYDGRLRVNPGFINGEVMVVDPSGTVHWLNEYGTEIRQSGPIAFEVESPIYPERTPQ